MKLDFFCLFVIILNAIFKLKNRIMILTNEMLETALRFRSICLWEELTDSDVFAFRLSDGETGYCSVMGNAGEHFSLGFYRGKNGFSSYLKTLDMGRQQSFGCETFETVMTFDCINCDFVAASTLDDTTKKRIRKYVNDAGLKISRSNGWPDFTRFEPYKAQYGITCEKDARDITEALRAAIAVSEKLTIHDFESLGFDKRGAYPTAKGSKLVPYLIPTADGTYEWSTVKLPALVQDKYATVKFENDILVNMVKALPASCILQLRIIHIPTPVNDGVSEVPYFPAVLICIDADSEYLWPIFCKEDFEKNPILILVELADTFRRNAGKPQKMQVEDAKTEALLEDFCRQCSIVLVREQNLSALNEAWVSLLDNFMSFS